MQSADLEVQERASCAVHILKAMDKLKEAGEEEAAVNELVHLFQGELNPVAPKAQRKVPVPEGYVDDVDPTPLFFVFCAYLKV